MLLRLHVAGSGEIVIDFRSHAYGWNSSLDVFPNDPEYVHVETEVIAADAPSPFDSAARDLDSLLWKVGFHSFDAAPASWLPSGERSRLIRWPNLTEFSISLDQVRMTAMLGNAFATAGELAAAAGTSPADAQRLVNAYSLMGILTHAPIEVAPAPVVAEPATDADPAPTRGLLQRLRARLGL